MGAVADKLKELNPFQDVHISGLIPESISNIFLRIGEFIDDTVLVFLNAYVVLIILLFFAVLILIIMVPIKLVPIYKKNRKLINKLVKLNV